MRSFWMVGCCWILNRQLPFLNSSASLPRREMACYIEPFSLLPVWDTEMTSGGTAALSSLWSLRMKASCFKVAELRDRGICIPGDSSSSRLAPTLQLCPLLVRADILETSVGCVLDYSQVHSLEHQPGWMCHFQCPTLPTWPSWLRCQGVNRLDPRLNSRMEIEISGPSTWNSHAPWRSFCISHLPYLHVHLKNCSLSPLFTFLGLYENLGKDKLQNPFSWSEPFLCVLYFLYF